MTTPLLTRRCPACESPVELDSSNGHDEIHCTNPECGKTFSADATVETPRKPLVAPPVVAPAPISEPRPARPAAETVVVRPAMIRRYPIQFLGLVLLIAAGIAAIAYWASDGSTIVGLVGLALLGYGTYRAAAWWTHSTRSALTITDQEVIVDRGGFKPIRIGLPLTRLREVQIAQTMYCRIVNVGDLVIDTDEEESRRIVVMAVAGPRAVAEVLHERHNGNGTTRAAV